MNDNIIPLPPRAVPKPKTEKPEPVESLVKICESLLARAKDGSLRGITMAGVDLVPNPDEYVSKYCIFVSTEYDAQDSYTLEHFLLSGHAIAKRRLMDLFILPDVEAVEFPPPEETD